MTSQILHNAGVPADYVGRKTGGRQEEKEQRYEIVSVIYRWEMTALSAAERCRRDNVLQQQVRQVLDLNAELHASNNLDL